MCAAMLCHIVTSTSPSISTRRIGISLTQVVHIQHIAPGRQPLQLRSQLPAGSGAGRRPAFNAQAGRREAARHIRLVMHAAQLISRWRPMADWGRPGAAQGLLRRRLASPCNSAVPAPTAAWRRGCARCPRPSADGHQACRTCQAAVGRGGEAPQREFDHSRGCLGRGGERPACSAGGEGKARGGRGCAYLHSGQRRLTLPASCPRPWQGGLHLRCTQTQPRHSLAPRILHVLVLVCSRFCEVQGCSHCTTALSNRWPQGCPCLLPVHAACTSGRHTLPALDRTVLAAAASLVS